jgi:hypothetical protein
MKLLSVPSFFRIASILILLLLGQKGRATNYTDNGSSTHYHLYAHDTLFIRTGTYTGKIETFVPDAVIFISAGSIFQPKNIENAGGIIINYGYTLLDFNFNSNTNHRFLNYGTLRVTKNCILMTTNNWVNAIGATIEVERLFQINASTFVNSGEIKAERMQVNGGSLFTNRFKINIANSFEVNGGSTFNNLGFIESKGAMNFNQGTYQNDCQLSTEGNFSNSATFINRSIITITNNKAFDNYGTFTLSSNAIIKAAKFNNYQSITGSGSFYLTGETENFGRIGVTEPTTDTIRIYDATRTNAPKFFDVDWGSVRPNTVFRNLTEPDPAHYKGGCAVEYIGIVPLPIKWETFSIRELNGLPYLNWKAVYEANTKFIVERSYNGQQFYPLATFNAIIENNYQWTDKKASNTVVFYRIKAVDVNGEVSYSETKKLVFKEKQLDNANTFPSPFTNKFVWSYYSSRNAQFKFQIHTSSGQLLYQKHASINHGQNSIPFLEAAHLLPGIYSLDVFNGSEKVSSHKLIKE